VTLSYSYYNIRRDLFWPVATTATLQAGERFDKVAQECSEDKAKGNLALLGL
jgi:hypothetical protein